MAQRSATRADWLFVDERGRPLSGESLADELRADLRAAGVTRTELLEAGKNRQPIRVHDLRGTFMTLALANGRSETWVADRTGHTSSQMINRYRRRARGAEELELGNLLPMDQVIPELCQRRPTRAEWQPGHHGGCELGAARLRFIAPGLPQDWWVDWDSNPGPTD